MDCMRLCCVCTGRHLVCRQRSMLARMRLCHGIGSVFDQVIAEVECQFITLGHVFLESSAVHWMRRRLIAMKAWSARNVPIQNLSSQFDGKRHG